MSNPWTLIRIRSTPMCPHCYAGFDHLEFAAQRIVSTKPNGKYQYVHRACLTPYATKHGLPMPPVTMWAPAQRT